MILNTAADEKFLSTLTNKENLTIKASAKAFSILSSQLYSNPIKAIIRELSCNAIDAHKEIKNSDPYEITLPTAFDPYFKIQDFGVGMSPSDIKIIYSTYFESTKTSSNEMIGALGLGSKTPFAYISQFFVESVKEHTCPVSKITKKLKTKVLMYIDETNVPARTVLSVSETDEHTGTLISFAVKEKDVEIFAKEAVSVFLTLEQLPVIHHVSEFTNAMTHIAFYGDRNLVTNDYQNNEFEMYKQLRQELPKLLEGPLEFEKWKQRLLDFANLTNDPAVIMGGVVYPFTVADITKNLDSSSDFFKMVRSLIGNELLVIYANIGDISIAPSREAIVFDEATVSFLWEQIVVRFITRLNEFPNLSMKDKLFFCFQPFGGYIFKIARDTNILYNTSKIPMTKDLTQKFIDAMQNLCMNKLSKKTINSFVDFFKQLYELSTLFFETKGTLFFKFDKSKSKKSYKERLVHFPLITPCNPDHTCRYNNDFDHFLRCVFHEPNQNLVLFETSEEFFNELKFRIHNARYAWTEKRKDILILHESWRLQLDTKIFMILNPIFTDQLKKLGLTPRYHFNKCPEEITLTTNKIVREEQSNIEPVLTLLENSDNAYMARIKKRYPGFDFSKTLSIKEVVDLLKKGEKAYYIPIKSDSFRIVKVNTTVQTAKELSLGSTAHMTFTFCYEYYTTIKDIMKLLNKPLDDTLVFSIEYGAFKRLKLIEVPQFQSLITYAETVAKKHEKDLLANIVKTASSESIPRFLDSSAKQELFINECLNRPKLKDSQFYHLLKNELQPLFKQLQNPTIGRVNHLITKFCHTHLDLSTSNMWEHLQKKIEEHLKMASPLKLYELYPLFQYVPVSFNWDSDCAKIVSDWCDYAELVDK